MKHYAVYSITIAICLSALAGYIDAIGFLELGGYFISFMSGNSTRLVVGLVTGDHAHAILIGLIILCFVGGAMTGTVAGHLAQRKHQPFTVLTLVTAVLTVAIASYENGHTFPAILCMTFAMGAENTIFQRDGDIAIGLTYMTGTLVKVGQRLGQAFFGGGKLAFLPYLTLWLGLIGGGATGVALFQLFGLHSLWLAAIAAACLTLAVKIRPPH